MNEQRELLAFVDERREPSGSGVAGVDWELRIARLEWAASAESPGSGQWVLQIGSLRRVFEDLSCADEPAAVDRSRALVAEFLDGLSHHFVD